LFADKLRELDIDVHQLVISGTQPNGAPAIANVTFELLAETESGTIRQIQMQLDLARLKGVDEVK
jgi:hypothetical protein